MFYDVSLFIVKLFGSCSCSSCYNSFNFAAFSRLQSRPEFSLG